MQKLGVQSKFFLAYQDTTFFWSKAPWITLGRAVKGSNLTDSIIFLDLVKYKNLSYGKPENPVTFICVVTIHKGVTQIKQINYIQGII